MGHATALLELGGVRLLTDPLLRPGLGHLTRRSAPPAPEVMAGLDAVLISHLHLDHLDLRSLRILDPGVRLIVPHGAGEYLRRSGFPHAEEVAPGESVRVAGRPPAAEGEPAAVEVLAVPAVHDDRRMPFRREHADPVGFVVRGGRSVYFAGDTDIFDAMDGLEPVLDVALLPVWGWGPSLGEGHLDPLGAARAAAMLRPRLAVPIHWGTFYPRVSRKRDRLTAPPREFAAHVAELAPEVEVRVLEPGDSLALGSA